MTAATAGGGGLVLAVSPHLDDAVLAVGATLAALADAGREVIVCTVFAGDPPPGAVSPVAEAFHRDCGLDDGGPDNGGPDGPVAVRRAEDRAGVREIGACAIHLPFTDAIYRRRADGQWLCRRDGDVFEPGLPAEPELRAAITASLGSVLHGCASRRPTEVWTCAGIGGHIDHLITRMAAHDAVTGADAGPGRVSGPLLWEALPYAVGTPITAGATAAGPVPAGPVPAAAVDVGVRHLDRKLAAVARYRSQLRMLWPAGEDWRCVLRRHAAERGRTGAAEPLWRST